MDHSVAGVLNFFSFGLPLRVHWFLTVGSPYISPKIKCRIIYELFLQMGRPVVENPCLKQIVGKGVFTPLTKFHTPLLKIYYQCPIMGP